MAYQEYFTDDPLRPLVSGWIGKIDEAKRHKKPWQDTADECMRFFSASAGWMWNEEHRSKTLGKEVPAPRFRMTIAKAFELVALFGPVLFWRYPVRTVLPKQPFQVNPILYGDPMDPFVQQAVQMEQMRYQQEAAVKETVAELRSRWLNYTPGEMPNGGLKSHGQLATTEALVKGRGVLVTRPYQMPGSQRVLTGSFYHTVDKLFVDPDATCPDLSDAQWICLEHVQPHFDVEQRFGLPPDSLKKYTAYESGQSQGERKGTYSEKDDRQLGKTFDLVCWYEIWSKGGVGGRLSGMNAEIKDALNQVTGKYCYLAVCKDCPYPLNAPTERLATALPEEVARMFDWPIPYWRDDRWPVSVLDFYRKPGSVWPIAPMSPGLGELKFLNVMVSHLCNRIVMTCRDFVGAPKAVADKIDKLIASGKDLQTFDLPMDVGGDVRKLVQVLQFPQVNADVWMIIEKVSELFDKRVGLSELLYGLNPGAASRSAEDAAMKRSSLSVRPDWMASCVEDWQTECARMEDLASVFFLEPQDLIGPLGQQGAQLWQQLILSRDIEEVLRETDVTIEAGSARKPNKDRDIANWGMAMPILFPLYQQYMQMTGDVNPINWALSTWAKHNDMDIQGGLLAPPPPPQPMPEQPVEQAA